MDIDSEYGVDPIPYTTPPDPENNKVAYKQWTAAGIPVYGITIQGSTHFDFSLAPTFPTSSWCPQTKDNQCVGDLPASERAMNSYLTNSSIIIGGTLDSIYSVVEQLQPQEAPVPSGN